MILYHGTASPYLPSIREFGLNPSEASKYTFRLETADGKANPYTQHAVYLTTSLDTAKTFAELRAEYVRAQPGEHIADAYNGFFWKDEAAPDALPDAQPVVLELDVPEDIAKKLHADEAASERFEAFWYKGVIPATAIKEIFTAA